MLKIFFVVKNYLTDEKIYHHIGIYAFTNIALAKVCKALLDLDLEIDRNLEQMRAMENNFSNKSRLVSDSQPFRS